MYKLIRDNIPELMEAEDKVCNYAECKSDELFKELLIKKLDEEVNEFKAAIKEYEKAKPLLIEIEGVTSRNSYQRKIVAEAADILEVVTKLISIYTSDNLKAIVNIAETKRKINGGFDKKLIGFFPGEINGD